MTDITQIDLSQFLEKEEVLEEQIQMAKDAKAFKESCGKYPLEVYRMEKFKPTL